MLRTIVATKEDEQTSIEKDVCADKVPALYMALLSLYSMSVCKAEPSTADHGNLVSSFGLTEEETNKIVKDIETDLISKDPRIQNCKIILSYILDELICNIQQHAGVKQGYICATKNQVTDTIDICLADFGITILGSYIKVGRYLDMIGDNAAEALCIAKDGYSTKNRPEAENRGYGISSNVKMIAKGLHGTVAILSGNAIMITSGESVQIASLPEEIEWQGTCIVIRIPIEVPKNFSLYDYIA